MVLLQKRVKKNVQLDDPMIMTTHIRMNEDNMISVSHPVLLQLYRRMDRTRPVRQVVEPGSGVQARISTSRPEFAGLRSGEHEGNDFQSFFLKALEKKE
ncbi:MAG: hypothetical protein HQM01_13220 [Magnetococcales bacterium]|nr:hypothetical protein [Magnetococcales bacterium]